MKHPKDSASNDVIGRILKNAVPVKGPVGTGLSMLVWVACSLVVLGVGFATLFTLRHDLQELGGQIWFIANMFALAAVFGFASYAGFMSALPGRARPWLALLGLRLALLGFFLTLVPSLLHLNGMGGLHRGMKVSGLRCSLTLVGLGIIPGLLLFFSLKRLAPVNPTATARMIGLAMGAMGAFGLGLDCMVMNPVHILIYHGLPILVLGLLGTFLGQRILRW